LITLAKKHDLFLVADEVYREFAYDGAEYISMMTFPEVADRVILADSISKRFSACGARIGNIVSHNKDVMAAALRLGQARLCPPTIEQVGAIGALKVPHAYYEAVKKEYQHRRDVCMEGLAAIPGARAPKPAGAFYIFAELPIDDANEFAKFMLNDFNVNGSTTMVAPGDGFYGTPGAGKKEIRLAYVLNENDLRAAMAILKQGVAAYQQTRMGVTAK
jgi:aspartate aminotransferase